MALKSLTNTKKDCVILIPTLELSKLIGCSDASISRWENEIRTPNAEVLVSFAKFYNVSTDYLCGLEN